MCIITSQSCMTDIFCAAPSKKANQDLEQKGRFVEKITKIIIIMQCDEITKQK